MSLLIALVFALTYLGMAVGRVPGLRLDRTGIAFIAAVALLASGAMSLSAFGRAVDLPTLLLLFGLMIVSGQFVAAGFYDWVAARLARADGSPARLLGLVVLAAGALSAVLANDVVAFAMAPVLAEGTRRRGLDPRPYLLALAGASNAGSAMTLIGNPQNILIGQVGHLDFWRYFGVAAPAGLAALAITYGTILWLWRDRLALPPARSETPPPAPDQAQTAKGVFAILALAILFATPAPRDLAALAVAALLLISRRTSSRALMAAVDWPLLLLFAALFAVTAAFSGLAQVGMAVSWLAGHGLLPDRQIVMAPLLLVLSNTIGNVPAVILILKSWAQPSTGALTAMALLSTLAGNLLLVGSLANIIVAERAWTAGVTLSFRDFARAGIPMTLLSLGVAIVWLAVTGALPWR